MLFVKQQQFGDVAFLKASPQYHPLFFCLSAEESCLKCISTLNEWRIPVGVKADPKTLPLERPSGSIPLLSDRLFLFLI